MEEIKLAMMEEGKAVKIRGLLDQIACNMTYMSEGGYYLVRFPEGTKEEKRAEPDQRYQEESIITLPHGPTLKKVVHWPCRRPGCTHIELLFPGKEAKMV